MVISDQRVIPAPIVEFSGSKNEIELKILDLFKTSIESDSIYGFELPVTIEQNEENAIDSTLISNGVTYYLELTEITPPGNMVGDTLMPLFLTQWSISPRKSLI